MKQKVLFSLLILMLMSISVSAQTGGGRIAGVVIDNTDEDPLPGATLFIEELKKGDVTNKYGEFSFSDIPFGTLFRSYLYIHREVYGLSNSSPKSNRK